MNIDVSVVSLPDYERLVAEIWMGDRQVGLVTNEDPQKYLVTFYADQNEGAVTLEYQDIIYGLALAFKKLQDLDREG